MGTNYYWFKKRIHEGAEGGLHIGKNSAGWVFHFEAHEYPRLKTVQDYKEFLKKGFIYNEYDEKIPYNEFWEIVEDSVEDCYDRPPYSFVNLPKGEEDILSLRGWMSEDYMFSMGDFC